MMHDLVRGSTLRCAALVPSVVLTLLGQAWAVRDAVNLGDKVLGTYRTTDLETAWTKREDSMAFPDDNSVSEDDAVPGFMSDMADRTSTEQDHAAATLQWIDGQKTVRAVETKCGLDFIGYLFKAALHLPQHLKAQGNEYMTEIIGKDWEAKVQDKSWKPTAAQKGQQTSRMFAVKLSNGKGVLLYSPININAPGVHEAVKEMGKVTVIVLPNTAHYLHAWPWELAYPEATVIGPRGFARSKKCRYGTNGTMVNPVACLQGGEAPAELGGGLLGPVSMWSSAKGKSGVVDRWSDYSNPPTKLNKNKGVPLRLDEDFTIFSWQGDTLSKEFLFYHKQSKTLIAGDWLYVSTALTMEEEWTWSTDAKLFALIMSHGSPSPALPLYRSVRTWGSTMDLFNGWLSPPDPKEEDMFQEIADNDRLGNTGMSRGLMMQDWAQMRTVRDMVLQLDIGKVLLCHTRGFPEGDFAKEIIRATWGFLTNNHYCCCKRKKCSRGALADDGVTAAKMTGGLCCKGKAHKCGTVSGYKIFAENTKYCQP